MFLPPLSMAEWAVLHWDEPKKAGEENHVGSDGKKAQQVLNGLHSYYCRSAEGEIKLDEHFLTPFMSSITLQSVSSCICERVGYISEDEWYRLQRKASLVARKTIVCKS